MRRHQKHRCSEVPLAEIMSDVSNEELRPYRLRAASDDEDRVFDDRRNADGPRDLTSIFHD